MVRERQRQQHNQPEQFDRGRSWLVLLGAFVTGAVVMGNTLTLSTLYEAVVERVQNKPVTTHHGTLNKTHVDVEPTSSMVVIMLFATVPAVASMTGIFGSFLTHIIGYKITIAAGTLLAMTGFGLSALATRIWHMYLTMGLLAGTGLGITFIPANGVLSFYFSRKYFNFAGSVAATSASSGVFAYSYIHPGLHSGLKSWPAAMLVEAAICALLFISALAIRESDVVVTPSGNNSMESDEAVRYEQRRKKLGVIEKQASVLSTRTETVEMDDLGNFLTPKNQVDVEPVRGRAQTNTILKTERGTKPADASDRRLSLPNNSRRTDRKQNSVDDSRPSHAYKIDESIAPIADRNNSEGQPETITSKSAKRRVEFSKLKSSFFAKKSVPSTTVNMSVAIVQDTSAVNIRFRNAVRQLFPSELFRHVPFYLIMIQCLSMLTTDLFLILTPSYLVESQHWTSTATASRILTVFGGVSVATRIALCLFNCRPSLARRVPISLQIAIGIVMVAVASSVYLSASASIDVSGNAHSQGWMKEPNALLFAISAAVCALGGALIAAYQAPLVLDIIPRKCFTFALAMESVVIGIFIMIISPLPGVLEQAFGTLRYGYSLVLAFCLVSLAALISIVISVRLREKRERHRV